VTQVESLATTVTNLVVTPQTGGASLSFTTGTAVRAQLQVGTTSGTYGTKFGVESVVGTVHLLYAYGLQPATTYHYILQFYDQFSNLLDATADATFTTLAAPAAAPSGQSSINGPPAGGGASVNTLASAAVGASATSTIGQDGTTLATHGTAGVTFTGGKLTVQKTGFYMLFASIQTAADISSGPSQVRLLLGGTQNVGTGQMFHLGSGSSGSSAFLGQLSAGTTIDVQVVNGSATATTVASGSVAVGGVG
jgi:hypothetical protein